jgi:hypothetical protein
VHKISHARILTTNIHQPQRVSPFECISCDYIPFNRVINGQVNSYSVRGYTGCIIYVGAATDMLWIYLVFNKGEWLNTLQRLIREYGPTTNSKSTKLKFLRSDFCKELQSAESAEYFRNAEILLHSSTPYKHAQNPAERKWQQLKSMHTSAMLQNNTPVRYHKHTDGYHSQDTKDLGMKNSPERDPILVIVYLSIPTDGLMSLKKKCKPKE